MIYWAILATFAFGVALVAVGGWALQGQIGIEIAKAGLQLVVIAGLGGGLASLLRRLDSIRRERNQIDEYRLNVLREVIVSYNKIKSARRVLRAFGFRSPRSRTLTPEQVTEFVAQMRCLNEAQLSLERIKRELETHCSMFPDPTEILESLRTAERYIHDVVKDWEDHGESISPCARIKSLRSLQNLTRFLGDAACGFKENAAGPMNTLEKVIRAQLLRGRRCKGRDVSA